MPYPNEHAARIRDPGLFIPDSFRSKNITTGIRIIVGRLKGETSMIVQAYRFSVDNFTEEEAKKWLKDHDVTFIKFESADQEALQHIGVLGMHWGQRKGSNSSTSSEHNRAVENRNPFTSTMKEYRYSHRRLSLEKTVTKIQEKGKVPNHKPAKAMTDKEIKEFLRNPTMKKKLKEIKSDEEENGRKLALAALALGYTVYATKGMTGYLIKAGMKRAIDAKNAARVVKVASDVIDLSFKR